MSHVRTRAVEKVFCSYVVLVLRHYHSMEVFATFDIINERGEKVAEGHKASFCLEDNQCLEGVEPQYACANYGDQGESDELNLITI